MSNRLHATCAGGRTELRRGNNLQIVHFTHLSRSQFSTRHQVWHEQEYISSTHLSGIKGWSFCRAKDNESLHRRARANSSERKNPLRWRDFWNWGNWQINDAYKRPPGTRPTFCFLRISTETPTPKIPKGPWRKRVCQHEWKIYVQ